MTNDDEFAHEIARLQVLAELRALAAQHAGSRRGAHAREGYALPASREPRGQESRRPKRARS
jgi:hypothetical protein